MDLHDVTERAIALMKEHEHLNMDNYNDLVGGEATGGEEPVKEAEIEVGVGYAIKLPSGKLAKASNGKTWWNSSPEGANKVNASSYGGEGKVVKVNLQHDQYAYNGYTVVEGKKKITAKNDPCWSGYHMVGTKKKNGREVPNCVPGKKGK
jgi:hypothetical protein